MIAVKEKIVPECSAAESKGYRHVIFVVLRQAQERLFLYPRYAGQGAIRIYQRTISPDHGFIARFLKYPVCRYHPTCSEFAHEALGRYGLVYGTYLAARRILRCTPWHKGGYDPVN